MKKRFFILAAVLFSSQLFSQHKKDSLPVVINLVEFPRMNVELTRVVVTATKFPGKQAETGKAMTVITRSQLERSSGKTLGEVLNTTAGTTIIGANNNLGTNQTASIRGASAGNVLILIDGIPVNDPSVITNYFDLNLLAIDQIERIEILKGGQSTLYGSDAVAGVINIISRKAATQPGSVTGSLSGGSYHSFKESIGFSGTNKALNYSLNYMHLRSKGFSSAYDAAANNHFDKDGFDQQVVNGHLNVILNNKLQAIFSGSYSYYNSDLDASAYTDEKDYTVKNKNAQAGAGLLYHYNHGAMRFNYNFNYLCRDYLDDSIFRSNSYVDYSKNNFIGRTHFAEIYGNWKWNKWELLAGLDYRFNNTDQYSLFVFTGFPTPPSLLKGKMSQVSPYASMAYKNGKGFTAEAGGRWNHHSEYGSNFTFTINPSYLIKGKVKLFANLYSAFKIPTLYQLFDPSAGNTDLKPEKGIIGEAGAEYFANNKFRLRAIGFYRNTKNAIQYVLIDPVFFTSQYRNVSKQENYGTELEVNYEINKWAIGANYTYTDGKTRSGFDGTGALLGKDTTYYNLYRIPKNSFNLSIGWQATGNLFISTQLRRVSKRTEFIYGLAPETQKGYATVDLYGEYKFSRNFRTFADLKNITNKLYFDIPGYNSRRFNMMAGMNFQF